MTANEQIALDIVKSTEVRHDSHHMKIKAAFMARDLILPIQEQRDLLAWASQEVVRESLRVKKATRPQRHPRAKAKDACTEEGCNRKHDRSTNTGLCTGHNEIAGQENLHSDMHDGAIEDCAECREAIAQLTAYYLKPRGTSKGGTNGGIKDPLAHLGRYADKIVSVTEIGQNGRARRVIIRCQLTGCDEVREIATQDLFQVSHCCIAHKREHQRQLR